MDKKNPFFTDANLNRFLFLPPYSIAQACYSPPPLSLSLTLLWLETDTILISQTSTLYPYINQPKISYTRIALNIWLSTPNFSLLSRRIKHVEVTGDQ